MMNRNMPAVKAAAAAAAAAASQPKPEPPPEETDDFEIVEAADAQPDEDRAMGEGRFQNPERFAQSGTRSIRPTAGSGSASVSPGKSDEKTRFSRPPIPSPTLSLRLNSKTMAFRPGGGHKVAPIRPGGTADRPKQFSRITSHIVQFRKVGVRKPYSLVQLLSVRHQFRKFLPEIQPIAGVFEEGLGEELGEQLGIANKATPEQSPTRRPKKYFTSKPAAVAEEPVIPGETSPTAVDKPSVDKVSKLKPSDHQITTQQTSQLGSGFSEKRTKKAWVPRSLRQKEERDPMEEFTSSLNLILNKLSKDNFNTLLTKIKATFTNDVNTLQKLGKLVEIIFEKCILEPKWGELYSQLCKELSALDKRFEQQYTDPRTSELRSRDCGFKDVLLTQCETEFRKGKVDPTFAPNASAEDKRLAEIKQKKLLIGTMTFIGQLYIVDLLPSQIMSHCLKQLIGTQQSPSADDVESAYTLLCTVGQKMDSDATAKNNMKMIYRRLQSIGNDQRKYAPRIRILIQNLFDFQRSKWKNKPDDKLKSVAEVHREFKASKQQKGGAAATPAMDEETLRRMIEGGEVPIGTNVAATGELPSALGTTRSTVRRNRYGAASTQNRTSAAPTDKATEDLRARREAQRRKFLLESTLPQPEAQPEPVAKPQPEEKTEPDAVTVFSESGLGTTGPALEKEEFMDWYRQYLKSEMNDNKLLGKVAGRTVASWPPLLEEMFRVGLDSNESQQERVTMLWQSLIKKGFFTPQTFSDAFNDYFEYYTTEIGDVPKLSKLASYIFGPMFEGRELSLSTVAQWLGKDPSMNKPHKSDSSFSYAADFIGNLFKEIREAAFENRDGIVQQLVKESNFDINQFVDPSLHSDFAKEYSLSWFFK